MADDTLKTYNTGADKHSVGVDHYGNGKGTRDQFQGSDPSQLNDILNALSSAASFASVTVAGELSAIRTNLSNAWQGQTADDALHTLDLLQTDATNIGNNTKAVFTILQAFQTEWSTVRDLAGHLDDDDDQGAKDLFDRFTKAQNDAMHAMPSSLEYYTPLSVNPDTPTIAAPTIPTGTGDQFHYTAPDLTNTGGGGLGALGGAGGAHGTSINPNSHLAGLSNTPPGSSLGDSSGAGGGGAGSGGVPDTGEAAAGAGGAGRGGMMAPMGGAGQNQDKDRDRSTWLAEDEDVWGGSDAPPSVIR